MLDVEIKHDIDKNYLVIRGSDENTYMLKMLAGNSVKGFLDLEVRVLNNVNQYYYDITGKESFQQKSARNKWTGTELRKAVSDILGCLQKSREYLLTPEHFVLNPEYVYRSMDTEDVYLCYAWNYEENVNGQLTELFAYFMNVVDYDDRDAVDLVYKLYDTSREENCTLQRLWGALSVPKVKRVVIEEEQEEEKVQDDNISGKVRKPLRLKSDGERKRSQKSTLVKMNKNAGNEKNKEKSQEKGKEKSKPEELKRKNAGKKSEKSNKKSKNTASGTSMLVKVLLIVAVQAAIIGIILFGASAGFFFENGGISYTKTGGSFLVLGVVDMYLLTKIFGEEEQNEKQSEQKVEQAAWEEEKERPFVLAKKNGRKDAATAKQSTLSLENESVKGQANTRRNQAIQMQENAVRNQIVQGQANTRRNQTVQVSRGWELQNMTLERNGYNQMGQEAERASGAVQKIPAENLDGTVVLDFGKTIVDQRGDGAWNATKRKMCYLVPDENEYGVISLGEFPFFIGRFQKDTDSLKESRNISRMHSKIEQIGSSFFISDLNSTNGTFVNQKRVEKDKKIELYEGDQVMFANIPYHFTMQQM